MGFPALDLYLGVLTALMKHHDQKQLGEERKGFVLLTVP